MNGALNALGARLDDLLLWLRVVGTAGFPTVSHAEAVYSPLIVAAFLWRVFAVLDLLRLQRRLKREGKDEELGASVRERLQRSQRGMLRIGVWGVICWSLLVNYEYTTIVFTLGVLLYGVVENIDGALGWKYQQGRRRYWAQRDAMDDYAERVAAVAREAAERAEAAARLTAQQGQRIEAAIAENTALTREVAEQSSQTTHIRQTTDITKEIAADTHAILRNGNGDGPKGDAP